MPTRKDQHKQRLGIRFYSHCAQLNIALFIFQRATVKILKKFEGLKFKMTRVRHALLFILSALIGCGQDDVGPSPLPDCVTSMSASHGKAIDGRYIVSFESDTHNGRIASAQRVIESLGISPLTILDTIDGENLYYVMAIEKTEADEIAAQPGVWRVEPDRVLSINACFSVVDESTVTWNVDQVGYSDGTGKTAWILDTGADLDHSDLNVDARSRSFNEGETSADDDNGHGTHIAGIIGAKNNRFGTLGIASGANIVALKILDQNGEGLLSIALKALAYAKSNARAGDAVNISMGLEEVSDILDREIQAIASKGIFVVIAAGNESRPANNFSPARTSGKNIYTVTAVDSTRHFASFSNYGNDVVDFAAPGVRILSTYKGNKYAIMSGTSMAAPHVTALLLITNGDIHSEGVALDDPDGTPDPIAHR